MQPSSPHIGLGRPLDGPGPATLVAGLTSVAIHIGLAAWFFASGGSPDSAPPPAGIATAFEVTLMTEPSSQPAQPAQPEPVIYETPIEDVVAVEPQPDIIEPVEPVETAEAVPVETEAPREVATEPVAQLAAVQPPARPKRPAPQPPTQKAKAPPPAPPQTDHATKAAEASAPPPKGAQVPIAQIAAKNIGAHGTETAVVEKPATFPGYLANPAPAYPASELRRGREGLVVLLVRVTPNGRADDISIQKSSGISAFDREAVRAVRRWRFLPATKNGQPVFGLVKVPIRFTLRKS